jgi:hypothetical protein
VKPLLQIDSRLKIVPYDDLSSKEKNTEGLKIHLDAASKTIL